MSDPDTRGRCITCMRYVRGWCQAAIAAGMSRTRQTTEIGPELARLPQHCPAYLARPL